MEKADALFLEMINNTLRDASPEMMEVLQIAANVTTEIASRGGSESDHLVSALLSQLVARIIDSQKE